MRICITLDHVQPTRHHTPIMQKKNTKDIYILAIDGGGIRGIIPVMVLQEMERILAELGDPRAVSSCFDLIAGTSTGGLISLALAAPHKRLNLDFKEDPKEVKERAKANNLIEMYKLRFIANRQIPPEPLDEEVGEELPEETEITEKLQPRSLSLFSKLKDYLSNKYHDKERTQLKEYIDLSSILDIYEKQGEKIFPKSAFRQLQSISQVFGEKYDVQSLEKLLDKIFGDLIMKEAMTPVFVTTYDCYGGKPFMIRSYGDQQFPMKEAARATSAAPTYFTPLTVSPIEEDHPYCLIDGGICVNNPALVAYIEAKKLFGAAEHYHILSLGTASTKFSLKQDQYVGGGMIGWMDPAKGSPLYQAMRSSQYGLTDYALNSLPEVSYHRIDGVLDKGHIRLDDAREENITLLKDLGIRMISEHRDHLKRFCEQLIR